MLSIIFCISFRHFSLLVCIYFLTVGTSLSQPSRLTSVDLTCYMPIDLLGESHSVSSGG